MSHHRFSFFHTQYRLLLFLTLLVAISTPVYGIEIIAFGDSITAGTGSAVGGYPARLQRLIESHGKPCHIYDFGIPGEKTDAGVQRIDTVLDTTPADMILIMEGTNDVRKNYRREITQKNLQLIIDKAKARGVLPVLATLTPSNQGRSDVLIPASWNPMITELARKNKIPLVDHYGAIEARWIDLNLDGIHPNDAGHDTLAKIWDDAIEDMIAEDGTLKEPGSGNLQRVIALAGIGMCWLLVIRKKKLKSKRTPAD